MATNFEFLKRVDKNLYTIITEAEMLYRDEYFEQCMVQTRRFGEHVCKSVLGDRRRGVRTFDDMLATLKDNITGEEQEKEFINDLYFLKKHGNNSAHSVEVHKDEIEALECLQRAFEVAINFCVYSNNAKSSILKLRFDTELLVTGEKSKKSLAQKYKEEKRNNKTRYNDGEDSYSAPKTRKTKKTTKSQSYKMVSKKGKSSSKAFWIFVGICSLISTILLCFMAIIA